MKRLIQNRLSSSLVASTMLFVVVAFASPARSQDEKPALPSKQKNNAAAESKPKEPVAGIWTCSLHPRIHQSERGNCPICGTQLVTLQHEDADSLMSLDRMLSLALRHNPDIRADRAKIIAAEAELDRTRLEVVQEVIAYRQRWKKHHQIVCAAARELEQAQQQAKRDDLDDKARRRVVSMVSDARGKLAITRAGLGEIEAEIPFLLGRPDVAKADAAADPSAAIIQDDLIPKIEQLVAVMVSAYQVGNARLTDLQPWLHQLAELKIRTATTKAERIAAVQLCIEMQKSVANVTETLYRTGEARQADLLAAQIHLAEAELRLTEVGDDSR